MTEHLTVAIEAARSAGALLRENFGQALNVDAFEAHDIKLELDVRSQELITGILLAKFPDHAIFGEEGIAGNQESPYQWIVDPIDGTVNFFYGLPHFCISIALRHEGEIILGVIYDPMRDELWQVERGGQALLNGKPVKVSPRTELREAVLSVGFSKSQAQFGNSLGLFEKMLQRVRKCRLMGSAALDLAYVATGRLDGYIESSVSLWDIAAGQLLVEAAGGKVEITEKGNGKLAITASSGKLNFNVD